MVFKSTISLKSPGRTKRRTAAAAAAVDVPPPWVVMADEDDAKHAHACAQNTSVDAGHGG